MRQGMHTQNILPQNGGTPSQRTILFCVWSSLDPAPDLLDQCLHLKLSSLHAGNMLRCYYATLLWSLVIEHVVNPLRQWEGSSCLMFPPTLWFQGLRVTGRGTWALAITSTESRTKLERKGPWVNEEERPRERGWNFKNAITRRYDKARTMVTIHTTTASSFGWQEKEKD